MAYQACAPRWSAVFRTRSPERMTVQRYDSHASGDEGGGQKVRYWKPFNYPVLDSNGQVTYIIHQSEEVTELLQLRRKDSEHARALVETNGLFQAMYDQGIFAGRLGLDGKVIDVNRPALEQCGFRREEIVGKLFWECGWWNGSPEVQKWVKAAIEQALRGEPFRGISPYFCADGSERVVDFACMPIKDDSGKVLFLFPTGIDVTERTRAESDRRATEILESITDAFLALDRDWRIVYANRQALEILELERNDLIGKVFWEAFPGSVGSDFEVAFQRAMSGCGPTSTTSFYPDYDRWYEAACLPGKSRNLHLF